MAVAASVRILREYQRGVVFQLGRFWKVKGPGLVILIPGIQQMLLVDLRTVVMDVPAQDVITRDNVSVKVNAVVYARVVDPQIAIIHGRRVAGVRQTAGGGTKAGAGPAGDAVALPADAHRDRRRANLHDHLPDAHRPDLIGDGRAVETVQARRSRLSRPLRLDRGGACGNLVG